MRTIAELNERRIQLGLTLSELSDRCHVPVPTLQKIFSGTTTSPRFSTLRKIEDYLFADSADRMPYRPATYSNRPESYGSSAYESRTTEPYEHQTPEAYEPRTAGPYDHQTPGAYQPRTAGSLLMDSSAVYSADRPSPTAPSSDWREILSKPQGAFTVSDYEQLPEDQHYELIDGVLIRMESPSLTHQQLVIFLATEFRLLAEQEDCDCLVVCAPFDVQLDRDERTIVQPDVVIICDEDKVTDSRGYGAPDLCIEVLSPTTRSKDQLLKKYKYERAGVREFWVVDPEYDKVTVHLFGERHSRSRAAAAAIDIVPDSVHTYSFDDKIPIGICEGHFIDFSKHVPAFLRRRR